MTFILIFAASSINSRISNFQNQYNIESYKNKVRDWRQVVDQWKKTAGSDLKVAQWLFRLYEEKYYCSDELDSPPYNWICLISFDCIEKALKGTMIALWILKKDDLCYHDIQHYVDSLDKAVHNQFKELKRRVGFVKKFYFKTRWPNQHGNGCTPGDYFNKELAMTLLCLADDVFNSVNKILDDPTTWNIVYSNFVHVDSLPDWLLGPYRSLWPPLQL